MLTPVPVALQRKSTAILHGDALHFEAHLFIKDMKCAPGAGLAQHGRKLLAFA
jgi:hypothetical protein